MSLGIYLTLKALHARPPGAVDKAMLAVVAFQNLSTDLLQDYFVDGLTAEMISQLGQLSSDRLGVIALELHEPLQGSKEE